MDLETNKRFYPHSNTAAHVIGYVGSDDSSAKGEDAFFSYRMPDYRGLVGIEGWVTMRPSRGRAPAPNPFRSISATARRKTSGIKPCPAPTSSLTLDFNVQRETEAALRKIGPSGRGAVVVMDVRSGDILAMASHPTFSPNQFAHRMSQRANTTRSGNSPPKRTAWRRIIRPARCSNHRSIAALETPDLDSIRNAMEVQVIPPAAGHGVIYVGKQPFQAGSRRRLGLMISGRPSPAPAMPISSIRFAGPASSSASSNWDVGLHLGEKFDSQSVAPTSKPCGTFFRPQTRCQNDGWRMVTR